MISKEESERILREDVTQPPIINKYSTSLHDWLEDVSILHFPDLASKILTKDALFVVHAGFDCSYKLKPWERKKYPEYVEGLRAKVKSVLGKKSVLVWTEYGFKERNIRFLDLDRDSLILVPTDNNCPRLKEDLLRMGEDQFYKELSSYVESAELIGEYAGGCVKRVERDCKGLIKINVIENLTYSI